MRTRKSFFIRWLKTLDPDKKQISIIDVEHVQSGETWRVTSIEDAAEMMKKIDTGEVVCEQVSNRRCDAEFIYRRTRNNKRSDEHLVIFGNGFHCRCFRLFRSLSLNRLSSK